MSRTAEPLRPAEYAILSLLCLAPHHGYELASRFTPEAELGSALPLELGDLYAALKRLEARGLVTGRVEPQVARPARRVYSLTALGRQHLRRWLAEPVRRNREVRLDFALKLYFARLLPDGDPGTLVATQLAACQAQLTDIEAAEPADPASFRTLMRQLRLVATRGTIEWLTSHAAEFAVDSRSVPR